MPDLIDVRVDGLDELRAALTGLSKGLDEALRGELLDQARKVAREASSRVPRQTGSARAALGAQIVDGVASVTADARRAPYFGWLEYGGRTGRGHRIVRAFVKDGRYIGRAVDGALGDIEAAAARAVIEAGRRADLEVTGG